MAVGIFVYTSVDHLSRALVPALDLVGPPPSSPSVSPPSSGVEKVKSTGG